MANIPQKTALVVSAHSADFVWRAGGAIALHVEQGYQVHVVCLSYGERGESTPESASHRLVKAIQETAPLRFL